MMVTNPKWAFSESYDLEAYILRHSMPIYGNGEDKHLKFAAGINYRPLASII